jgi:hypothetical protein
LENLSAKEGNPKIRDFFSHPWPRDCNNEYPGGSSGERTIARSTYKEMPENAIFEALHRQSEANFIKSVGGIVIGVDADFNTRYERITKRHEGEKDEVTYRRVEDTGGA